MSTLVARLVTDQSGAPLAKYGLIAAAIAIIVIIAALGSLDPDIGTTLEASALLS